MNEICIIFLINVYTSFEVDDLLYYYLVRKHAWNTMEIHLQMKLLDVHSEDIMWLNKLLREEKKKHCSSQSEMLSCRWLLAHIKFVSVISAHSTPHTIYYI